MQIYQIFAFLVIGNMAPALLCIAMVDYAYVGRLFLITGDVIRDEFVSPTSITLCGTIDVFFINHCLQVHMIIIVR